MANIRDYALKGRIGFIGIGQCGGNIAMEFENDGFPCLFINSSKKDLDTIDAKHKLHFPDAEGCSRDRDKAFNMIVENAEMVEDRVRNVFEGVELVYICTSTGGGTGSGMTPALSLMMADMVRIGVVCVMPDDNESLQTQYNTLKFFSELAFRDGVNSSMFCLDNSRGDRFDINKWFYQLFTKMLMIPSYISTKGNFDESELWNLLTTKGYITVGVAETPKDEEKLTASVLRSIENNYFTPIDIRKGMVESIGISSTGDIDMRDLLVAINGNPNNIFQGYNNIETVVILSGLSTPNTRIDKVNQLVKSNRDAFSRNAEIKVDVDVSWLKEIAVAKEEVPVKKKVKMDEMSLYDFDDIFDKYTE